MQTTVKPPVAANPRPRPPKPAPIVVRLAGRKLADNALDHNDHLVPEHLKCKHINKIDLTDSGYRRLEQLRHQQRTGIGLARHMAHDAGPNTGTRMVKTINKQSRPRIVEYHEQFLGFSDTEIRPHTFNKAAATLAAMEARVTKADALWRQRVAWLASHPMAWHNIT